MDVTSSHCVIDGSILCVSFGRAVPASGGLFSLFHEKRGDSKIGRDE